MTFMHGIQNGWYSLDRTRQLQSFLCLYLAHVSITIHSGILLQLRGIAAVYYNMFVSAKAGNVCARHKCFDTVIHNRFPEHEQCWRQLIKKAFLRTSCRFISERCRPSTYEIVSSSSSPIFFKATSFSIWARVKG